LKVRDFTCFRDPAEDLVRGTVRSNKIEARLPLKVVRCRLPRDSIYFPVENLSSGFCKSGKGMNFLSYGRASI